MTNAIDNTATAWGEALQALRDEALTDAKQRDSSTQLAVTLDDLARVLDAYVVRLAGVERIAISTPAREDADGLDFLDEPEVPVALIDMPMGASVPPAAPADLPEWLLNTLASHHERIVALEERVVFLENNANLTGVAMATEFVADAPIDPDDYKPESWGSIDRARQALSNRVRREHARRSAIRQTVLNAVSDLAFQQDADPASFSDDDRAQLFQQRARAERLAQIDVTRDVKIDDIAGLDDLNAARAYDAETGWPE